MDEHEQGEQVRDWLRQNGATIITGIAVGIAGIFGFNWWQGQQVERGYAAGSEYQRMVSAARGGDIEQARAHATVLDNDFATSPYAVLGALRLAAIEVAGGDHEAALAALDAARGRTDDPALDDLLGLRAARLHIAAGENEQAIDLLDGVSPAYSGMAYELRGDALLRMGRDTEARDAYVEALTHLDSGAPARGLVEVKLIDLGGSVETPEA